jgi:D-beta-D-heptose 7-phosphate kinase/D-beta-D-heptose 1-phosphate adenosyltransferase
MEWRSTVPPSTSAHAALLARFPAARLLVAGDVMLDRYIYGSVARISPEAPVPVVRQAREVAAPGGAANTAANIAGLGATVTLLGVMGRDAAAESLVLCLEQKGVSAASLLVDPARPTSVKTRVVAHPQQVVRLDDESNAALPDAIAAAFLASFTSALAVSDAVVLSDYGKGVLSADLVPRLIELARAAGKPVLADPKTASPFPWRGVTLLKPNRLELGLLAHRPVLDHQDTLAAAAIVLVELGGGALLVTEGADGMTLFESEPASSPTIGNASGPASGATSGTTFGNAPRHAPGTHLEDAPRLAPGDAQASQPDIVPDSVPQNAPGNVPGTHLENAPGHPPRTAPRHFAALARSVYDVTGAGDTVLATVAVAIAAGASLPLAAELGLRAAALVVQKQGTEVITLEELRG